MQWINFIRFKKTLNLTMSGPTKNCRVNSVNQNRKKIKKTKS